MFNRSAPPGGASSSGRPPDGKATGRLFPLANIVLLGSTGDTRTVAPGRAGPTGEGSPGRTRVPASSQPGQPAVRRLWPIYQRPERAPDG
eukprot:5802230-Amphidinium_carterae.1